MIFMWNIKTTLLSIFGGINPIKETDRILQKDLVWKREQQKSSAIIEINLMDYYYHMNNMGKILASGGNVEEAAYLILR